MFRGRDEKVALYVKVVFGLLALLLGYVVLIQYQATPESAAVRFGNREALFGVRTLTGFFTVAVMMLLGFFEDQINRGFSAAQALSSRWTDQRVRDLLIQLKDVKSEKNRALKAQKKTAKTAAKAAVAAVPVSVPSGPCIACAEKDTQLAELQTKHGELETRCGSMTEELDTARRSNEEKDVQIRTLQSEKKELDLRCASLTAEAETSRRGINEKSDEIVRLQANRTGWESRCAALTKERDAALEANSAQLRRIAELEARCQSLSEQLEAARRTTSEDRSTITDLETQRTNLRTELESLRSGNAGRESELSELKTKLESAKARCTQLENDLEAADSAKANKDTQLDELRGQLATSKSETSRATSSVEVANRTLREKEGELSKLRNELTAAEARITLLMQSVNKPCESCAAKSALIEQQQGEISDLTLRVQGLTTPCPTCANRQHEVEAAQREAAHADRQSDGSAASEQPLEQQLQDAQAWATYYRERLELLDVSFCNLVLLLQESGFLDAEKLQAFVTLAEKRSDYRRTPQPFFRHEHWPAALVDLLRRHILLQHGYTDVTFEPLQVRFSAPFPTVLTDLAAYWLILVTAQLQPDLVPADLREQVWPALSLQDVDAAASLLGRIRRDLELAVKAYQTGRNADVARSLSSLSDTLRKATTPSAIDTHLRALPELSALSSVLLPTSEA